MAYSTRLIGLLLLLGIAISCWRLVKITHPTLSQAKNTPSVDAIMEGVSSVIFDKNGKPSIQIVSPKMIHYAQNNTTDIVSPQITVFREPSNTWHIEAKSATALQGLNQIVFNNQVVVHFEEDNLHPLTTLTTESLTIYPNQELAKTDQAVAIVRRDEKVNAVGMLANMNDGTVKLLSNAREEYVPNS